MIELLPWSDLSRVEPLLAASGHTEGLPGWFRALAETTLEPGETPVLAVAARAGAIAAVLPLVRQKQGWRSLTAPYTTRYCPAWEDVDAAYDIGCGIGALGTVRLDGLDPSDEGVTAFVDGLKTGLAVAPYEGYANWSEPVTAFARYWSARPSRLKATVKRKGTAAARFTYLRTGFAEALDAYEAIRAASWKDPEPHPDFLAALARHLAPQMRMGLYALEGRCIAAQIWLVHGGRATIFKLAHREDAAAFSPGTVLTRRMIETCLDEEPVALLDFGRGDDGYKRDWMGTRATRLGVVAADWRRDFRTYAADVLPTLAGRAWRRHFGSNRTAAATTRREEALASADDRGKVAAAEAYR